MSTNDNPQEHQSSSRNKSWVWAFIPLSFFCYWLFLILFVEQWSLAQTPPFIWNKLVVPYIGSMANAPGLLLVAQAFSFRVLRHFIPIVVGYWLVHSATLIVLQNLYSLPDQKTARQLLTDLQSWTISPRVVNISLSMLETDKGTLLRVGGPGYIRIRPENVIMTELNGRKCRVLAAGVHKLWPFERVKTVLDLRPQEHNRKGIPVRTKDGIPLTCDLGVTFCVDRGGEEVTKENPYPFNQEAVKRLAYSGTVSSKGTSTWSDTTPNMAVGELENILLEINLDNLFFPEDLTLDFNETPPNNFTRGDFGINPYLTVTRFLKDRLQSKMYHLGVEILDIRLGAFELAKTQNNEDFDILKAMTEQRIEYWRTKWEQIRLLKEAHGQVRIQELSDEAHNKANKVMIDAIVNGIKAVTPNDDDDGFSQYILAMRLLELIQAASERPSGEKNQQRVLDFVTPIFDEDGMVDQSIVEQARAERIAEQGS